MIILFLFSCNTPAKKESLEIDLIYWIDMSDSELIAKWGTPQNTYLLDDGGKIIEYVRETEVLIPTEDCVTVSRGPF